jgi:tripartite-type tricarboxylate transporter receptor subunit TctC
MSVRIGWLMALFLVYPSITYGYPEKSIRIVVGFPPGGGADLVARLIAQKLQQAWGQPVLVDNRAGAGGNLGTEIVAKSNPDGYTLVLSSPGPIAVNPSLMPNMPYNPRKDFAPVTLAAFGPNVLVVPPASPATGVKELIALARTSANRLNYGSSGPGSTPHLSAELFKMMAKVDLVHVPFKGASPAVVDLVAGRLDLMFVDMGSVLSQVQAQRLRALAVTSSGRSSVLPDVPTVNEAGLPGYEAVVWWGLLAPAGTPTAVIDKLHQAVVDILRMSEIRARLIAAQGAEVVANTPKEFAEFIQNETIKWATVIKAAGIKLD